MQQKVDACIGRKCALERTYKEVILNHFFSEFFWMPRKEIYVSV